MEKNETQRIEWIDIAKGIGILLVILGHSVKFGGAIHNLIFSFHMPLFFVLSGITYKQKDNKTFICMKLKTLIMPYIIFSLIGFVLSVMIPSWRNGLSIKTVIKDIYLTSPNAVNVSSIWFLVSLFWVVIVFNFIQKFNKNIQYIIIGVCLVLGFIYSNRIHMITFLPEGRLPFNIDTSLIALTFFAAGVWLKKIITDKKLFFVNCVLFIISFALNGRVNLHGLTFHNPLLYLLESISGTIILIFICFMLSTKIKRKMITAPLNWMGKHSLVIMGIQAIAVRVYVLIVNRLVHTEYSLYGLPIAHQIVCFISVTFISVLICLGIDLIKTRQGEERAL